jgi:hypothetical protein
MIESGTGTESGAGLEPGPQRLRTSDDEREQVATILRAAMTEGRLTLAEGEDRLAAAYAARFRGELIPLTADLPDGGRRALAETPEARRAGRRHLRRHGALVAAAAVVLVTVWAQSGAEFFWPAIPLAILGLGLLRHARHYRYGYHRVPRMPWSDYAHGRPYRWS